METSSHLELLASAEVMPSMHMRGRMEVLELSDGGSPGFVCSLGCGVRLVQVEVRREEMLDGGAVRALQTLADQMHLSEEGSLLFGLFLVLPQCTLIAKFLAACARYHVAALVRASTHRQQQSHWDMLQGFCFQEGLCLTHTFYALAFCKDCTCTVLSLLAGRPGGHNWVVVFSPERTLHAPLLSRLWFCCLA